MLIRNGVREIFISFGALVVGALTLFSNIKKKLSKKKVNQGLLDLDPVPEIPSQIPSQWQINRDSQEYYVALAPDPVYTPPTLSQSSQPPDR
jgi:hypothetical protein